MVLPEREDPECAANRRRDEPRCRYAAREGTTLSCRMSPTFSFCLAKKKTCRTRYKRKNAEGRFDTKVSNHPKRGAGRHKLPTKSRSLLPAALYLFRPELCPRTRKSAAHQCSKQDAPCPSFHCRSPVQLREGFPKAGASPPSPVPGRGFPKGEGRSPRPLCQRGYGGRWRPPCFGWGSKGEGPLR